MIPINNLLSMTHPTYHMNTPSYLFTRPPIKLTNQVHLTFLFSPLTRLSSYSTHISTHLPTLNTHPTYYLGTTPSTNKFPIPVHLLHFTPYTGPSISDRTEPTPTYSPNTKSTLSTHLSTQPPQNSPYPFTYSPTHLPIYTSQSPLYLLT